VRGFGGFNCGGVSSDRVASRKAVALVDHLTAGVNSMWFPACQSQQLVAPTRWVELLAVPGAWK